MTFNKNKLFIAVLSVLSLSACSHLAEHEKVSREVVTPIEVLDEISKSYKEVMNIKNDQYDVYKVETDDKDLDDVSKEISINSPILIKGTVKDAVNLITQKLNGVSVIYKVDNQASLDTAIDLYVNNVSMSRFIEIIEDIGDVDMYLKDGVLYVSDSIILEGSLSKLEVGGKLHYAKIKEHLGNILESSTEKKFATIQYDAPVATVSPELLAEGAIADDLKSPSVTKTDTRQSVKIEKPSIIIDEATGAIYIKATPKTIRASKSFIENFINASVSYANVELGIYRISNEKAREIGMSVSRIIDNLYSLSAGTQASGMINKTLSFDREVADNQGDILKTGIQMYEKNGLISSESFTILNVYNDLPTIMSDKQTTGYWIPGNLSENNTTLNGVSVVTYTEDKPEFITEDVGKLLTFTPRINLKDQVINMSIDYSDSKIYATETFTWKRNLSLGDVIEIKKPLKTENKLSSVVTITGDKYSLFAGFKSKDGSIERQFVPGLGDLPILNDVGLNSTLGSKSDTLFIMKASFPEKQQLKYINKRK